jgi:hypothetical protein
VRRFRRPHGRRPRGEYNKRQVRRHEGKAAPGDFHTFLSEIKGRAVSKTKPPQLPPPERLRRLCQSLAMLDAIFSPEWQFRYYSFNSRWSEGKMMASMRDGCGDDYFILFTAAGVALKGYAHESPMAAYNVANRKPWPGVLDEVPTAFADFLNEPAFSMNETTFCLWRRKQDRTWKRGDIEFPPGNDPDGSERMLTILDGDPRTYQRFCCEYYEESPPLKCIRAIYEHQPLTPKLVAALNSQVTLAALREDVAEIAYPPTL